MQLTTGNFINELVDTAAGSNVVIGDWLTLDDIQYNKKGLATGLVAPNVKSTIKSQDTDFVRTIHDDNYQCTA